MCCNIAVCPAIKQLKGAIKWNFDFSLLVILKSSVFTKESCVRKVILLQRQGSNWANVKTNWEGGRGVDLEETLLKKKKITEHMLYICFMLLFNWNLQNYKIFTAFSSKLCRLLSFLLHIWLFSWIMLSLNDAYLKK